jgi:hypothetical protein
MNDFDKLVAEWGSLDQVACDAECRLQQRLDDYCNAHGPVPSAMEIASARRLRFIARHRLRWILHRTEQLRAGIPVL